MGTQFNGANSPNQFKQGPVVGQLDETSGAAQSVACQIDVTAALAGLLPTQPVVVVDSGGGIPKIKEATGQSDDIFGLIIFDKKRSVYKRGDIVDVAKAGSVLYVNAAAAAARNAKAELVVDATNPTFQTQTATHTIIGRFEDKPAAVNDLVRLYIDLPGRTPQP